VGLAVQRLLGVVLPVDVEFPEEVVAMILTDATTAAITRARQFVEECGAAKPGDRHQLREAWRKLLGLGDASSPGTAELYLMQVAQDFAEAVVALADGTSVARTDRTLVAITKARNLVQLFQPGSFVSLDDARVFAEAVVELADGTSVARVPTQATAAVVAAARRIATGEVVVEFTREDLARAIVELAGARPNKIDAARADRGDWDRAAGDALCASCESQLYDHPVVPGIEWLRRRCDGRLVKL
jgi:hypothetical protein